MSDSFDPEDDVKKEKLAKLDKDKREQELQDVRWILGTKEGRRYYWRQLSLCNVFATSFTGNNTTFFNEGRREVGIRMLTDLNDACPEMYSVMQKEYAERVSLDKAKIEKIEKEFRNV